MQCLSNWESVGLGATIEKSFLTLLAITAKGGPVMKFMLHHLTGSLRRQTQYFDVERLRFGTAKDCDVLFDLSKDATVTPVHAELAVKDGTPTLRDVSGQDALLINNRQTVEAALHDGDLIQLGQDGPLARFRLLPDHGGPAKPWRYIVADSQDIVVRTPHPPYTSFLHLARHVATDIARYGSPTVKVVASLLVLIPMILMILLGVNLYYEYQAVTTSERRIAELLSQLETGRHSRTELERRIEQERTKVLKLRSEQENLRGQLQTTLKQQEAERRSQKELQAIREQLRSLESGQRFAEEVIARFETGVGLIHGGYGLFEKSSGRPLRYEGFDEIGNPLLDEIGMPRFTLEGDEPPVIIYFAGTGFLIDQKGTVLTNRHVVRLWEIHEPLKPLMEKGIVPTPQFLRIFFPSYPEPYDLIELAVADTQDFAILQTTRAPKGPTPLKLASTEKKVRVGEPVMLMSYPGTFDGLMSRLRPATIEAILQEAGTDPIGLPELLAEQGLIRPLTTQGHVTDVTQDMVTYEARIAGGSSGGPVLDREGSVIAVNHSELRVIEGMDLGVPIAFVRSELSKLKERGEALKPIRIEPQ